ncbi:hypothetical protein DID77_03480 [Candidatus Marinamargulisbacteria bacterium SCGC AG-439-L15]|nr:hypothetical protein DID77_03480 [Candidatus Marinamargulisbacteria bacterium SCGC AG-439-L15]
MGLRYCKNCNRVEKASWGIRQGEDIYCRKCKSPMEVFDSEASKVSSKLKLASYDLLNEEKDPLQLDGKSAIYGSSKPDPVIIQCEDVLKVNPNNVEAHFTLAKALMTEKKEARAKQHLFIVLDLDPDHKEAQTLAKKWFPKEFRQQIGSIQEVDMLGKDLDELLDLGVHYYHQSQFELAKAYFLQVTTLDYDHIKTRRCLADIYLQEENYKGAIAQLNIIKGLKISDFQIDYNMGIACYYDGNLSRALACFREAYDKCTDEALSLEIKDHIQTLEKQVPGH